MPRPSKNTKTRPKKSRNRGSGPGAKSVAELWGASAGRCNICWTPLLVDATTAVQTKKGEMAHIVGIEDGPRSPRSDSSLSSAERNEADNLILLCPNHHTEVDRRVDLYTVAYLRDLKAAFEAHVGRLTDMGFASRTLVLRMLGTIHGRKVPTVDREHARQVVLEDGRYPDFKLAGDHDLEIDLRDLAASEDDTDYFQQTRTKIQHRVRFLRELQSSHGATDHVSILAIGRIPALFQLGREIGDAGQVTIHHRRNQEGWGWSETAEKRTFECVTHKRSETRGQPVTVLCSVSAPLQREELSTTLANQPMHEIRPADAAPGSTVLDSRESQDALASVWRQLLIDLEASRPKWIDLVAAIPADAAVVLGRVWTPTANPPIRLWDRVDNSYVLAWETT